MSIDPRYMAEYIRLQMMGSMSMFNDPIFNSESSGNSVDSSGSDFTQMLQMMMQQANLLSGSTGSNDLATNFGSATNPAGQNVNLMLNANSSSSPTSNPSLNAFLLGNSVPSSVPEEQGQGMFGMLNNSTRVKSASSLLNDLRARAAQREAEAQRDAVIQRETAERQKPASVREVSGWDKRVTNKAAGSNGSAQYESLIQQAAQKYGVNPSLIKAVIRAESSFNNDAVSHAGAKGLMQLMDRTAASLGVTNSFDPQQNIDGGTKYLSQLLRRFKGEEAVALAAYNAGPGRVSRTGISTIEDFLEKKHLLPRETQRYVDKVLGYKESY